jgi:hypothetical protein
VHLLLRVLGIDDVSGRWYALWSGSGGDIGELAIVGALLAVLRRHNCEVHRCFRLARHATAADHHVCRKHHPDGPLTAEAVKDHHHRALRRQRATAPGESGERLYDPDKNGGA